MNDSLELMLGEQCRHPFTIGQIQLDKAESRLIRQSVQTGRFQAHVIIVVQVINADNLMTGGQQTLCNVIANKSCGACNPRISCPLLK